MKDPAFLFYSQDFHTGTLFFTNEQVGKYIRLLIAQHQHGHLTERQMIFICGEKDDEIFKKFSIDSDGKYYQKRLEEESQKRKAFSESRRNNRNRLNNNSLNIYFVKNKETGLIKIGSSVDVERRLLELKRQYKSELELLFVSIKYPQTKETELHNLFKEKQKINEWYALSKSDLDDIKNNHIKVEDNVHINNHIMHDMENEIENENENINNKGVVEKKLIHTGIEITEAWQILKKSKHWRSKSINALNLTVGKLNAASEDMALQMINNAIEGGWKGVFAISSSTQYKQINKVGRNQISEIDKFIKHNE